MKWPKLRELKEAVTAIFSKRYTTRFPAEPSPAPEGFRGVPEPDDEWCIGCEACSEVCPAEAIVIHDDKKEGKRIIERLYDRCNYCGQCELLCPQPEPGVKLSREYNLTDYTRENMKKEQEFKLIVCSNCGASVGTEAQILATVERMGIEKAYSSPDLILARQGAAVKPVPASVKRKETVRQDIFNFLCPVCRHKVYKAEAEK
jgi:hydrogenase-4 component H